MGRTTTDVDETGSDSEVSDLSFDDQSGTLCTEGTRASSHLYGLEMLPPNPKWTGTHTKTTTLSLSPTESKTETETQHPSAHKVFLSSSAILLLLSAGTAAISLQQTFSGPFNSGGGGGGGELTINYVIVTLMAICGGSTLAFALLVHKSLPNSPELERRRIPKGYLALAAIGACAAAATGAVSSTVMDELKHYDFCTSETIYSVPDGGVLKCNSNPRTWENPESYECRGAMFTDDAHSGSDDMVHPNDVGFEKLPTSLPTETTDVQEYDRQGTIPTEYGLLTKITTMTVSGALTGSVPTELGNLAKMSSNFGLHSNLLSSAIPTELGKLVQMRSDFWLASNLLSSTIPTQLGQLDHMSSGFWLSGNSLSSTIPTQLGQLDHMISTFWLYSNSLSSAIPTQLGKLDQSRAGFWLFENSLSSTIPTQLGQLSQMSVSFSLESNRLSTAIPTQLGKMVALESNFFLQSNSLSSAIPTQVNSYFTCLHRKRYYMKFKFT